MVVAGVVVFGLLGVVACSDDGGDDDSGVVTTTIASDTAGGDSDVADTLAVGEVVAAMEAVDEELGGQQEYFEVTASPNDVRLYVSIDDGTAVEPYVYLDGELAPLGDPEPAAGNTFTVEQVDFEPDGVLDGVASELPDVTLRTFSIVGTADGGVRYGIFAESSRGGLLDITVDADGEVLEAADAQSGAVPQTTTPGTSVD